MKARAEMKAEVARRLTVALRELDVVQECLKTANSSESEYQSREVAALSDAVSHLGIALHEMVGAIERVAK